MNFVKQFCIILGFSFAGEVLNYIVPLPIPASIYGIILLFICLELKIIPESAVVGTGKFLIEIMPVMFIPAAVGLIGSWSIIKPSFFKYAAVTVISTVIVMAVSGVVTQTIFNKRRKKAKSSE